MPVAIGCRSLPRLLQRSGVDGIEIFQNALVSVGFSSVLKTTFNLPACPPVVADFLVSDGVPYLCSMPSFSAQSVAHTVESTPGTISYFSVPCSCCLLGKWFLLHITPHFLISAARAYKSTRRWRWAGQIGHEWHLPVEKLHGQRGMPYLPNCAMTSAPMGFVAMECPWMIDAPWARARSAAKEINLVIQPVPGKDSSWQGPVVTLKAAGMKTAAPSSYKSRNFTFKPPQSHEADASNT